MPIPRPPANPAMFTDTVTIYPGPAPDGPRGRSGAPLRPDAAGATYPAIVSPGVFNRQDLNGTVESIGSLRVLALADTQPVVHQDDGVAWTPAGSDEERWLVAESHARPVGPGCWQWPCSEAE